MAIDFNTVFSRPDPAFGRTSTPSPVSAARNDFHSLVLALQSGDVDGALRALDAVRQDLTGSPKPASGSSPAPMVATPAVNDALDVLALVLYAREHPPAGTPATAQRQGQAIDYAKF